MVDRIHIFRLSRREESFSFGRKGKRRAGGRERSTGDACVRRVAGAHAAARARRGHRSPEGATHAPTRVPRLSRHAPATRPDPADAWATNRRTAHASSSDATAMRDGTASHAPFQPFSLLYLLSLSPPLARQRTERRG